METASILQIAAKIMHDLGAGYSESIYQNALHRKLARTDCTCVMEKNIPVVYEGDVLGTCRADIVTESHVIEVKAVRKMPSGVEKQVCKYVRHLMDLDGKARKGLVINFNQDTEQIETLESTPNNNNNTTMRSAELPHGNTQKAGKEEEEEEPKRRRKITPVNDDPAPQ
jgi:GxxExxY protein